MSANVAIQVIIETDTFNAQEAKETAKSVIVKVPHLADYRSIVNKISEKYPVMKNRMSALYYYDHHCSKKIIYHDNIQDFWKYHQKSINGCGAMNSSAVVLKHGVQNRVWRNFAGPILFLRMRTFPLVHRLQRKRAEQVPYLRRGISLNEHNSSSMAHCSASAQKI